MLFAVWNLSSTIQSILENADDGFRVVVALGAQHGEAVVACFTATCFQR